MLTALQSTAKYGVSRVTRGWQSIYEKPSGVTLVRGISPAECSMQDALSEPESSLNSRAHTSTK